VNALNALRYVLYLPLHPKILKPAKFHCSAVNVESVSMPALRKQFIIA